MPLFAAQLADPALPAPLWWVLAIWMFALGASIGSFMNVVVYRLPAGQSLVRPGSRCPRCKTPLAARDNVPIFGWLWLRGRCRYCNLPISPRYPIVELLVAGMFFWLAVVGPLSGGANLPDSGNLPETTDGIAWILWGIYAYQLFLLCSLVCAALAEFDGHALMPRLALPLLLVGWTAPLFWPELHPQGSGALSNQTLTEQPWAAGLADSLLGLAAGLALSAAAWPMGRCGKARPSAGVLFAPRNLAIAWACTGLYLGWQAVSALAAATAAAQLISALAARFWPGAARIGWIGSLAPFSFGWVVAWGPIVSRLPILGPAGSAWLCPAAFVTVFLLAGLTCTLRR